MNQVHILTGNVKTGKTTRLMRWAISQNNIDGIFQPVIDEKRYIYNIGTRTLKPLETKETENITTIGKYNFSNETFSWAQNFITNCLEKNLDWIIIDEIGPLELENKGLEPAVSSLFSKRNEIQAKILCVVRESILEKFLKHYRLQDEHLLFELKIIEDQD